MYPVATPGLNDCTDSLNDDQLDTMATTLDLSTAATGALVAEATHAAGSVAANATGRERLWSSFTPAHLRALMKGDGRAMHLLVESLLHRDRPRD